MLLFTELHCAAQRRTQLDIAGVNAVVDGLTLVDLERSDLLGAGTSSWRLRSADAIHLAVALRIEADELVAYDAALQRCRPGSACPLPGSVAGTLDVSVDPGVTAAAALPKQGDSRPRVSSRCRR